MIPSDIDEFVADAKVAKELDVTLMTIWRLDHDPRKAEFGWPPAVKIGRRNYRSRKLLEAFKARLVQQAFDRRRASRATLPVEVPVA